MAYEKAERELEWWFIERDAALGISGIGFDGGAQIVWDRAQCAKAHLRLLSKGHLGNDLVAREKSIGESVRELDLQSRTIASAAFTTPAGRNPWPPRLHEAFRRANRNWSLIGVALLLPEADAFAEKLEKKRTDPLRAFAKVAENQNYNPQQLELKFRPLRLAADRAMTTALDAYDALRYQRVLRERAIRDAEKKADHDRLMAKLYGTAS